MFINSWTWYVRRVLLTPSLSAIDWRELGCRSNSFPQVRPRFLMHVPAPPPSTSRPSSSDVRDNTYDVDDHMVDAGALFDTILENPLHHETTATAAGAAFILPPRCRVLMSDLSALKRHTSILRPPGGGGGGGGGGDGGGFQLIVLDPPWENASVRRGSQYSTVPSRQLLGLPLSELYHPQVRVLIHPTPSLSAASFPVGLSNSLTNQAVRTAKLG
jgi:hypothetical protein